MENNTNSFMKTILIVLGLGAAAYGAYWLYQVVISDATERIKEGVTEGVEDGMGAAINPLDTASDLVGTIK